MADLATGCALQANFVSTTCSVCGMMYCQGQESDEKLHAAYHSSHLQGIRFQVRRFSTTSRIWIASLCLVLFSSH